MAEKKIPNGLNYAMYCKNERGAEYRNYNNVKATDTWLNVQN